MSEGDGATRDGRTCRLCHRVMRQGTTEHHLIPRAMHSNKWFQKRFTRKQMQQTISVCRDCHRSIHRLIPSAKELGRHYHTLDAILAHEPFRRYLVWVRKQR